MYVNDVIFGASNAHTTVRIRDQLIALLASADMELGKWASNCSNVRQGILTEKQKECSVDWDDAVSTLGLKWIPSQDVLLFKVNQPVSPMVVTKRSILSDISKLFDPLG